MFKVWIGKDGEPRSKGSGSIEEQNTNMMKILMYAQARAAYMRRIADRADGVKPHAVEEESFGMTD